MLMEGVAVEGRSLLPVAPQSSWRHGCITITSNSLIHYFTNSMIFHGFILPIASIPADELCHFVLFTSAESTSDQEDQIFKVKLSCSVPEFE